MVILQLGLFLKGGKDKMTSTSMKVVNESQRGQAWASVQGKLLPRLELTGQAGSISKGEQIIQLKEWEKKKAENLAHIS